MTMQNNYETTEPMPNNEIPSSPSQGIWLSVLGLITWLIAMALAVVGPILGLAIPAYFIIGMVIFSGLFSLLSLPRLFRLQKGNDRSAQKHAS